MSKNLEDYFNRIFEKIKIETQTCDKCGAVTEYYNEKEKLYLCEQHQPMNAEVTVNAFVQMNAKPVDHLNVTVNVWEGIMKEKSKLKSNRKSKKRDLIKAARSAKRRKSKKK